MHTLLQLLAQNQTLFWNVLHKTLHQTAPYSLIHFNPLTYNTIYLSTSGHLISNVQVSSSLSELMISKNRLGKLPRKEILLKVTNWKQGAKLQGVPRILFYRIVNTSPTYLKILPNCDIKCVIAWFYWSITFSNLKSLYGIWETMKLSLRRRITLHFECFEF